MIGNRKSVIITGATGFIGSHLLKRLIDTNFFVIAVTRSLCHPSNEYITWCEWDKLDELLSLSPFNKPEAIIHLATCYGRDEADILSVNIANVQLPLNLITLAIKYKINKFINTDSYFSKAEFNYQYMRPYIISKNTFLQWGEYISDSTELSFINMRLEHVYGPGDGGGKFIPFVIGAFSNDEKYIELTKCIQKRDFIFVEDVVSAYLVVLTAPILPKFVEYQVGLGYSIELKSCIELIRSKYPDSCTNILYGFKLQRENEIYDSYADNYSLLELGWRPLYSLSDGLDKTIIQ